MAAPGDWSIIKTAEENNNAIVPCSNFKKPSIDDYFEEVDEVKRKCRLCSSTVKVTAVSNWGMKSHLKHKHSTEWSSKFEPFLRTVKTKRPTITTSSAFVLISPEEARSAENDAIVKEEDCLNCKFDSDYETMESSMSNQMESSPMKSNIGFGNAQVTQKKRKKFIHPIVEDCSSGWIAEAAEKMHDDSMVALPHDGAHQTNVDGLQVCSKNCLTKDEFIIFGNFVATELRNMKIDVHRRKLKNAVHKCLLELTAEEGVTPTNSGE